MWARIIDFVLGPRPERLPARVTQSIRRQQEDGEILIGLVQLFMVSFFGLVYTVAPKTSAGTGFTPVIWALSLYFVFTIARLTLACRRVLPGWVPAASVVIDMGMLMVLIWSFHLQYEQPASFYLKVPTMLYVFIFIALRTLRFEALYILLAGVVAAIGWLCLMLYVLYSDPTDPMITYNFVAYMTSNSILVGAEVDKILTILMVTAVLAVAVMRAQRNMIRSLADSEAARDLSRFVAREVAETITSADRRIQPGDGEVKFATVLFTDIEGFSTISAQLGPEAVMSTLNEYFAAVSEVIDRHGGVITQFEGDAMLIAFNTVTPDTDHAANAVRTAIAIQDATADRKFGDGVIFRTRCGINTGDMVTGAVGAEDRLILTVHGDEVNISARLEQLNKEYGTYVLVSERTMREAGNEFAFHEQGEVTIRGRETPTRVYSVAVLPAPRPDPVLIDPLTP
jgi:adenylate cyclase